MAEFILKPLTALGHDAPLMDSIGPWTLTERADVALASIALRRGREDEVQTLAAKADLPLPAAALSASGPVYGTFWMTPGMWMVEAPFASHEDIRAELLVLFGDAASITEQTDAWVRFDLAGEGLVRLFERLSNFDLASAPAGSATRTVMEHLGCYLIKRSEVLVTVYAPRSSAGSLHHALVVAAKSVL
ncbi:MAG: sarcosine oxidase subunit gamma [Cypionkella sp.]